jgi:hypothetical protein
MQNFLKDLTCGITYTPDGIKVTPVPSVAPSTPSQAAPTPVVSAPAQPIIYTAEVVKNYEQPSVKCADGTYDVANGVNPPCATKGGVYLPSLPTPAPAPVLPSGQSTVVSAPAPVTAPQQVLPTPTTDYSTLYDTAALGTAIAQSNGSAPAPTSAPAQKDDTQKYLMYGGIALVGVLVLNSLINRD